MGTAARPGHKGRSPLLGIFALGFGLLVKLLPVHAELPMHGGGGGAGGGGWKVCDVTAFGAKGDNTTKDTTAIKAAVAACHGGGEIRFPAPGKYLTGA